MTRTFYRLYLYVMDTALLVFAAIEFGSLLNTLLLLTPLRGQYDTLPDRNSLVQSSVLAVVAIVLSLAVGGFHYWLIRRDLAQDPGAGGSVVRSLALNAVQTAAALVALYAGLNALPGLADPQTASGLTLLLAIWIVAALVFGLVQVERTRTQPNPGAATFLRRLHMYGVGTIALITAVVVVGSAIDRSIQVLLIAGHAIANPCAGPVGGPKVPVPVDASCSYSSGLLGNWLQVVWVVAVWGLYLWLARGDARSVLRQVAGFFGFVTGLVSFVIGLERAFEVILRAILHTGDGFASEFAYQYAFVGAVLLGLASMAIYITLLLRDSEATALGRIGTQLTAIALAAFAFGVPFYVGAAQVLRGLLELLVHGVPLSAAEWALALALLIAGLPHVALAYLLRAQTEGAAHIGPRRAYTLAALAAGALTATIAAAMGLYIVVTGALGSPVSEHWGLDARTALVNTLVGLFIAGLHLWRFIEQRRGETPAEPATAPAVPGATPLPEVPTPVPATTDPVGAVLDALLAGKLTRDQAAAQLRALLPPTAGATQETAMR